MDRDHGDRETRIEAGHRRVWTLLEAHGESDTRTDELDEAVAEAERLVSDTVDHWSHPLALHAAGVAYTALTEVSGQAGPLAAAITYLTRALPGIDEPGDRADTHLMLMTLMLARWSGDGELADLDAAIECGRTALDLGEQLAGPDDPAVLEVRTDLGLALMECYRAAEPDSARERQALDEAIAELSAVTRALPGRPETADVRATLGRACWARSYAEPNTPELRRADVETVIDVLADAEDARSRLLRGLALGRRHAETDAAEDRDAAIAALRPVLDLDADDPDDVIVCDALLDGGHLLLGRGEENKDDADLDLAIACLQRALPLLPADHPERDPALVGLARGHTARGGRHPTRDRLDTIVSCLEDVWPRVRADPGAGDELRCDVVMKLGWARAERIRTFGAQPGDLDAVIEELAAARALSSGVEQTAGTDAAVTALLGIAHSARAQEGAGGRAGITADLDRAAELLTAALGLLPADDPVRPDVIAALAGSVLNGVNLGVYAMPRMTAMAASLRDALSPPPVDPVVHAGIHQALGLILARMSRPDFDGAIAHLLDSARVAPQDDDRAIAVFNLAGVLVDRYFLHGDIADVDTAVRHLDAMGTPSELSLTRVELLSWRAYRLLARALQGLHRGRPALIDEAREGLRGVIAELPEDHPHRARWQAELGMVITMAAGDDLGALREALPLLDAAADTPRGPVRELALLRAATVRVVTADGHDVERAIDTLSALAEAPAVGARACAALGAALTGRHRRHGASADLERGISWLREALSRLPTGHPLRREAMRMLAEAHRAAGDRPRSTSAGEAALEESAHQVLLQTGADRAIVAGRRGNGLAQTVASWHLADGMPRAAVSVLELGRGLALHAATAGTRIADELRLAGLADLTAEWDRFAANDAEWGGADPVIGGVPVPGSPEVPDDLRRRVLGALAATPLGLRLASPPGAGEITDALRRVGADALCYLLPRHPLPGGTTAPGRALLVTAAGTVEELALPRLHTDPDGAVQAYADAVAGITDPPGSAAGAAQRRRWREALDAVCDWAWPAAVGPLLDRFPPSGVRPPRLVLVPLGRLGVVPWHAARTDGHYAVERAVLSYAASGRQLIDAAHRPRLDATAEAVIVSDPTGGLTWSNAEARALRRHYPDARRLARPTAAPGVEAATAENVLAALPSAETTGASLLHLSCHGHGLGSPADSHLKLIRLDGGTAAEAPLTVERILRRAHGRPRETPGGLVVLSACFSDLTVADHDEALTLASAFLAAGAATVVGTRWQIAERAAALFGVVLHHHLAAGNSPCDALRAAQLWMLDPQRVAPDLPPALAALATAGDLDLTEVAAWAAFTHQGR